MNRSLHSALQRILRCALPILIALSLSPAALAQGAPETLKVGTRIVAPFVFEEGKQLVGFSIDLWREVARRIGVDYRLTVKETVPDLLAAVRSREVDLAVAAISITSEREKTFDFSQPIFESGLQILVRKQSGGASGPALTALFSPVLLQLVGVILALILVPAHIIWVVERRHKEGIVGTERYFPGIFHACWWSAATLATQADAMPRSPVGRVVAVIWMFTSVVFVAYFTAAVTSSLTVQRLEGDIRGPKDLPGRHVATTKGSTSAEYLRSQAAVVSTYDRIDQAYDALLRGKVEAVVFDSPILLYYAAREGRGRVEVAGGIFRQESYGILLPSGSPYRKQINEALLRLKEDGTYQQLYEKWFTAK